MASTVTNRVVEGYNAVVERGYSLPVVLIAAALALVVGILIGVSISALGLRSSALGGAFNDFGSPGYVEPRQGGR